MGRGDKQKTPQWIIRNGWKVHKNASHHLSSGRCKSANQNYNEIESHSTKTGTHQEEKKAGAGVTPVSKELLLSAGENIEIGPAFGKNYMDILKTRNWDSIWFSNIAPGHIH